MTDYDAPIDRDIICKDCGLPFTFTARDQVFYGAQGYQAPRRCRDCREVRKAERVQGQS